MGYYAVVGGERQFSLASLTGWSDFKQWAEGLPESEYDNLIHLTEQAWTQDLGELDQQVQRSIASDPPSDPSVMDTLQNLGRIVADHRPGEESIFVTDGMGPDDGEPKIEDDLEAVDANLNCGVGPDGFEPGNECAKGSGKVGKGSGWQFDDPGTDGPEASDPSQAVKEEPRVSVDQGVIDDTRDLSREELVQGLSDGSIDPDFSFVANSDKAMQGFEKWADRNADDEGEINGEHFEDHAMRMFAAWLPAPEDVADEIVKARGDANLANDDPSPPRRVPPQDVITERGLAEARREFRRLRQRIRDWHRTQSDSDLAADVQATMKRIRQILSDTRTATRLAGMLSPWLPELADDPPGTPTPERADLSIRIPDPMGLVDEPDDGDTFRFPFLEDAFDFLWEKEILSHEEFERLERDDHREVFAAPGVDDVEVTQRLRDDMLESLIDGESLDEFQLRMRDDIDATEHEIETLFRTHTHQAYVEGQERTLQKPEVGELFPFAMYAATNDTRVRDEHWALDGFVVRRGTEEYGIMRNALADWNCRCALIPLTESQAEMRDVKTLADIPPEVLAKYGA